MPLGLPRVRASSYPGLTRMAGFDLEELRALVALADHGSILGAAEAMNTSRARVRRLLDHLEASCGVTLVERSREGVGLTPAGTGFLPGARSLLGDARALMLSMRDQPQDDDTWVLRLGLHVGYPRQVAAAVDDLVFRRFRSIRIEHELCDDPLRLLPDRADLVISVGGGPPPDGCTTLTVRDIQQQLWGTPAFVDQLGPLPEPTQLLSHIVGQWREPDGSRQNGIHLRDGRFLVHHARLLTPDEGMLAEVALRGRGLVYAPLAPHTATARSGSLIPVAHADVGRPIPIAIHVSAALVHWAPLKFFAQSARHVMCALLG